MSERPEEPNQASDAESLLPIDEHIEEGHDAEGRKVRHRGIYLLPNLFTTANLFKTARNVFAHNWLIVGG